ncbi:hypothetical protein LRP88_02438 [Fusarium phalaenopsidis]
MVKELPFADIKVPSPGFGAMGINFGLGNNLTFDEAEPVLLKAVELGCTFWDTAYTRLALMRSSWVISPGSIAFRDKIFIASKCGVDIFGDGSITNKATHIKEYIEGTIERLGFPPDLYYLHRIDPTTPLEESIPALDEIRRAVPKFQDGNFYKNKAIVDELKKLASRKSATVTQIALAWVAAQGMIAIPGTTKQKRMEENFASRDIEFTDEECSERDEATVGH